jgi:hypothetical protein
LPSQLDDVADLARIVRTSRLFYYLTLPRLYEHVTLRCYSSLRYVNGKPEGYGGGSPFSMGLEGLASRSRNLAQYVKTLSLVGSWREVDTNDFTKGRIPDNTMVMNVAIRAAIENAEKLEQFRCAPSPPSLFPPDESSNEALRISWELDCKPMKSIYQGLATLATLTHLKIRFSSDRTPRPTFVIPAMPSLKLLHVANIDPLCYPDDISLLIRHATKLETLKLEFSPRMRTEREPSVNLLMYFRRLFTAPTRFRLKHLAFANLYTRDDSDLDSVFDPSKLESLTTINCMNYTDPTTVFLDATWKLDPVKAKGFKALKSIRTDGLDEGFALMLPHFRGLEAIYMVNHANYPNETPSPGPAITASPAQEPMESQDSALTANGTPNLNHDISKGSSPATRDASESPVNPLSSPIKPSISLASDYIAAITSHHGGTLRKLLLSDAWALGNEVALNIVKKCPNIEQIGLGLESHDMSVLRSIAVAAPKLWVFRMLLQPDDEMWKTMRSMEMELHELAMSLEFWRDCYKKIKYIGIGGYVVKLGDNFKAADGKSWRRQVRTVSWHEVRHIEIFRMDSAEL